MLQFKKYIFISLFLLAITVVKGQRVEIGVMLGASNYLGDLSNETVVMKETHFSAALYGRYNVNPKVAVKGFFAYGRVSGDDKTFASTTRTYRDIPGIEFNKYRNLNFYSDIFEFSVQAELNLLPNDLVGYQRRPFIPYAFLGLGVFNFNPKTHFLGKTIELQPLATEGQGSTTYNDVKKYNLTNICIPLGIGFRQKVGNDLFIGIEAGVRLTNTNYLDDVGGRFGSKVVINGATGRTGLLLSDRSWELDPTSDVNIANPLNIPFYKNPDPSNVTNEDLFIEDAKRSDRHFNKTDMYFMAGITVSYIIRFKGQGCPTF